MVHLPSLSENATMGQWTVPELCLFGRLAGRAGLGVPHLHTHRYGVISCCMGVPSLSYKLWGLVSQSSNALWQYYTKRLACPDVGWWHIVTWGRRCETTDSLDVVVLGIRLVGPPLFLLRV